MKHIAEVLRRYGVLGIFFFSPLVMAEERSPYPIQHLFADDFTDGELGEYVVSERRDGATIENGMLSVSQGAMVSRDTNAQLAIAVEIDVRVPETVTDDEFLDFAFGYVAEGIHFQCVLAKYPRRDSAVGNVGNVVSVRALTNKGAQIWERRLEPPEGELNGRWRLSCREGRLLVEKEGQRLFQHFIFPEPLVDFDKIEFRSLGVAAKIDRISCSGIRLATDQRERLAAYASRGETLRAARAASADRRDAQATALWQRCVDGWPLFDLATTHVAFVQLQAGLADISDGRVVSGLKRFREAWPAVSSALPPDHPRVIAGEALLREAHERLTDQIGDAGSLTEWQTSFDEMWAAWTEVSWQGKASLQQQRSLVNTYFREIGEFNESQRISLQQILRKSSRARSQFAQGNVNTAIRGAEAAISDVESWLSRPEGQLMFLQEELGDLLTLAASCQFLSTDFDRKEIDRKIREAHGYYRTSLPIGHPKRLAAECNLAHVDYIDGDWSGAFESLRQIRDRSTTRLGATAPETLEIQSSLAMIQLILGQTYESESLREVMLWQYAELIRTGWLPSGARFVDALSVRQDMLEHPSLVTVFTARAGRAMLADPLASHGDSLTLARLAARIDQMMIQVGDAPWRNPSRRANEIVEKMAPLDSPLRIIALWRGFSRLSDEQLKTLPPTHPWSVSLGRKGAIIPVGRSPPAAPREKLEDYPKQTLQRLDATLERSKRVLGEDHPETAWCHEALALMNYALGRFDQAASHTTKSAEIFTQRLGARHPRTLSVQNTLGIVEYYRQNLQSSFAILQQNALDRRELLGSQHIDTLRSLSDLSVVARSLGRYQVARTLIEVAINEWPRDVSADDGPTAIKANAYRRIALANRCVLQAESGDYASAEAGFQELLQQSQFEQQHREILLSLSSIAIMKDDFQAARQYLLEVDTIRRQSAFSLEDPQLDHALGVVYRELRDLEQSRHFLQKALAQRRTNQFGAAHELGDNLISLGILEQREGNLDKAQQFFLEAATKYAERLGLVGLRQADAARRVALAARLMGNDELAVRAGQNALNMKLQLSDTLAASLSEAEALLFANTLTELEPILSGLSVDREKNAAIALESVWRRKAIVARLVERRLNRLRASRRSDVKAPQDRLRVVRRELATLLGPQFRTQLMPGGTGPNENFDVRRMRRIIELTKQKESLERDLARISGVSLPAIAETVQSVAGAMPANTALVEFVKVNIWPSNREQAEADSDLSPESRYQAFVLVNDGDKEPRVSWYDLGPASEIDRSVDGLRQVNRIEAQRARGIRVMRADREQTRGDSAFDIVGHQVIDAWAAQVARCRHLYIVPDGVLHGIPWAAMPANQSKHLIETASISLLSRGPQLVGFGRSLRSTDRMLIVGNLSYGTRRKTQPQRLSWNPLLGTERELRSINRLVADRFETTLLQRDEANEATTIEAMRTAKVVHLATHGFFTPDQSALSPSASIAWRDPMLASPVGRNPLSRCGIVLAGANRLPMLDSDGIPYGDDGLLTGEELCDLDLRSVRLVVLSACETGLGRIADNEGAFGLHRALSNAGAGSMIGSLWQVSDEATMQLMTGFYQNWMTQDVGVAAALRQAQLSLLERQADNEQSDFSAAYYWAAFVVSGDPNLKP